MTDKILTEAFNKLKAIEENEGSEDNYGKVGYGGPWDGEAGGPLDYEGEDGNDRRWETNSKKPDDKPYDLDEDRVDIADGAEELTRIQANLFELIEDLDSAIRAYVPSQYQYWRAYGLAHLKVLAGSDEYASSERNINTLIQDLKDEAGSSDDDNDADLYPGHPDAPSRR